MISNERAIKLIIVFACNFDSSLSWIDEISWTCSAEHIKNKFTQGFDYCGNAGIVPFWFMGLDKENQNLFIEWLLSKHENWL